jgi:hypothetical protein
MPNNPNAADNLKPFVKGYDPRRNLRGTPKDVIAARKLIRKIAAELLTVKENGGEYEITRLEAAIRLKFGSRAPKDFETLLKALYPGLLKDEIDVTSDGEPLIPVLPDEERLARMKQLAILIADEVRGKDA